MNEFSWEKLQALVGKERFTLSEAIPALIDNQEALRLSESDLEHIIAILFKFETAPDNCLIFTTFNGLLRPKDLAEARQIIKEYKDPIVITNLKEDNLEEQIQTIVNKIKSLPWHLDTKDLNKEFEIGVDKEGGDSTSIMLQVVKRKDEVLGRETKLPLFLRYSNK